MGGLVLVSRWNGYRTPRVDFMGSFRTGLYLSAYNCVEITAEFSSRMLLVIFRKDYCTGGCVQTLLTLLADNHNCVFVITASPARNEIIIRPIFDTRIIRVNCDSLVTNCKLPTGSPIYMYRQK